VSNIIEKEWGTQSGLPAVCLVCCFREGVRHHRCGYVGVPIGHPLYGVSYDEQLPYIKQETAQSATVGKKSPLLVFTAAVGSDDSNNLIRRSLDVVIDVHGGLTYAKGSEGYPSATIKDHWWFGFDCGHAGDGAIDEDPNWPNHSDEVVRSQPYVEAECESLAAQLLEVVK